jgi:short-subunit dehydrogenase
MSLLRAPATRGQPASLTGRRILITGGSSGIGLAVAERLAQVGGRLVLLARGREAVTRAAARVGGSAVVADVSRADETEAAVQEAVRLLGGLDAVIAGAGAGAYGPFAEMDVEDYERAVQITLLGTMNTVHAALPHLEESHGAIVVIGSVAGRVPAPWLAAYAAAKHGVRGFLRSLDGELRAQRRPVSVALIAPGPVDTPFWQRAATPDQRLPPEIRGAYRAEDVAREVLRALQHPGRLERSVGGLMAAAAMADALAPNLVQVPLGPLARLGWRARHERPPSPEDALSTPTSSVARSGGLSSRPSLLQRFRELISAHP